MMTQKSTAGYWPDSPSWRPADLSIPAGSNADGAAVWHTGTVELRCVIVDDDVSFLKVARTLLESGGVTVAGVASSCAEAVQRVEALRPDIVLIDIRLGEESGFDAARLLAADGRLAADGQAPTLIMISTHAAADYADLIAESPVIGFLPKAELSAAAIGRILKAS
jgi:CheY-like chemotaxis protein